MKPRTAALAVALLAGAGLSWFFSKHLTRSRVDTGVEPIRDEGPEPASPVEIPARTPALSKATDVVASEDAAKHRSTARQVLAEYWGSRWGEMEAAMLKAGLNLDVPYELVPWEEVGPRFGPLIPLGEDRQASLFKSISQWPIDSELTADWIESEFSLPVGLELGPEDVQAVTAVAQVYNDRILNLITEYTALLDTHLRRRWQSGDFVKAPFSTQGISGSADLYSTTHALDGWSVVINFNRVDYPELQSLRAEAVRERTRRNDAVDLYLRGRGYFDR